MTFTAAAPWELVGVKAGGSTHQSLLPLDSNRKSWKTDERWCKSRPPFFFLQDPAKDRVPGPVEVMTASVTPLALDEETLLFTRKNHLDSSDL